MNIPEAQIVLKKKVGEANGKDVVYIKTVGGLHLMVNSRGNVLGSGPHRAVARHLATKFEPDIQWTELSKADHVPLAHYEHLLPEYEALTKEFRKAQGL
jgi:hypothetical protein